ncbi:MAG: AtpZ/AtpI family protein [Candidatus Sulfobium sp.]|jgi:ATP synthase protein I
MKNRKFSRKVEQSAEELRKARKEKSRFWHYAQMLGVGGWLFVIPVVAGAYIGRYIDEKTRGDTSWTITFIIIGIAVGIYNIWYFLLRDSQP